MVSRLHSKLPSLKCIDFIKTCCKFGDLKSARQMLDEVPEPHFLRAYAIIISAYTRDGYPRESLSLYKQLRDRKINPDNVILLTAAKACATLGDLKTAKEIHGDAIHFGLHAEIQVGNALIDMYSKCRHVDGARQVFNTMLVRDVITWTSLCSCYVNSKLFKHGLETFREMGLNGVRANEVTMSSILPACSQLRCLNLGREIHGFAVRNGIGNNMFICSSLVNMYAASLSMREARIIFDNMLQRDVVSWNVILSAYFANKEYEKGLALLQQMRNEGIGLDYATWNSVIGGCLENGLMKQAVETLGEMQKMGFKPNRITIASILPACTISESLRAGKEIHSYIYRHWFDNDVMSMTALIFMYAKCGELELSRRVFDLVPKKDTIAWNTMIIAYSMHGNGEEALLTFRKMRDSGISPNRITFTGLLSGCSHSKLVEEARLIFDSMNEDHKIVPDSDHCSCMVDVLSRAGHLEEAYNFINKMGIETSAKAWGALLGACRVHKNVNLAKIAAKNLFEIEPKNSGTYVLLFNILVTAKLWEEASETRKLMKEKGIMKKPGCSWVHVKNRTYRFTVGDWSKEQSAEIYEFLDGLGEKMRLAGYVPNTDCVLQDVGKEEKVESLCGHSERLAVAFGILNLNGSTTVRVFKNLRICGDCHNAIKCIAKIVGVKIVVRDSLRFHYFQNGSCSCRDFW